MADTFNLKVVVPTGTVLEAVVSAVQLPSSNGEIGVLPDHTKYVGLLGSGVLEYTEPDGRTKKRFTISGGFCSFASDTLSVLADSADLSEKVVGELN